MTNPFEDENAIYHVLVNEEGQHSLWPSFVEVPAGWAIVLEASSRSGCLEYINCDLLQIEWVKRSGFSRVDGDFKGSVINLTVTRWRHV